jgi:methyltransferase (TIGR00027 family)
VTDTARWIAAARAVEAERPDALFRDPYARELAGERGARLYDELSRGKPYEWAGPVRTHVFNLALGELLAGGVDAIVNLAAGLDTRPYWWSAIPPTLRWYEVDLPVVLDDKERVLAGATPRCPVERIRLDLADAAGRRALLARIAAANRRVVAFCEGLLVYLTADDAAALAGDLATAGVEAWIADLFSPGLLAARQRTWRELHEAAPLRFAPAEGPAFFERAGWRTRTVRSLARAAAQTGRPGLLMRLIARLPEPSRPGSRPWSGVCTWERAATQ